MNDKKMYEFKESTVDEAIAAGLKALGLTREEVDVEIKSYGGIFNRASVILTPKQAEPEVQTAAEATAPQEEAPEDFSMEAPESEGEKPLAVDPETLAAAEKECVAFVTALLEKMGVSAEVFAETSAGEVSLRIEGIDAGQIIGYRGEVLDAIQYYMLVVANKGEKSFVRVQLDAGNYRKKRKETLANLAMRLARNAAKTGRRTALEPMNPFERRVIHTTLADDKFVTTESEGEGKYRHVVIIPNARENRYDNRERSYGDRGSYGGYNNNRSEGGYNRDRGGYNRDRSSGGYENKERSYGDRGSYGGYNNNRSEGGYNNNRSEGGYNNNRRNDYNRDHYGYNKPQPAEPETTQDESSINSDFKKKGPSKTRSFGYNNKKF